MTSITRICVERILPKHQDYYDSIKNDDKLSAAFFKSKLWANGRTITITFLDNPSKNQPRTSMSSMKKVGRVGSIDPLQKQLENSPLKDAVKTIVKERISPLVNLNFVFVDDKNADIRISFADENASWSMVGTDSEHEKSKGTPSMNLGWFDVGTYIHEFGHALGMIHEHQNPKGSYGIKWDIPKVVSYMEETQGWDKKEVEKNVIGKYKLDQINGSQFDPLSVMLYFFPNDLTTNNKGTRQNFRLSGIDTEWLSKTYPGGRSKPVDFYQRVYGESLASSISNSNSLRKNMGKGSSKVGMIIGMIFAGMIFTIIIFLIFYLIKK
uniref:Peptidase metallopeptidase domain-containing protein n=1 Tax=viral metagenome TaxID=1070528 RepID=A0A6C0LVR1_9ZZZZ